VGQGLGDVDAADAGDALEVGDGAGQTQDAGPAAGADLAGLGGAGQQGAAGFVEVGDPFQEAALGAAVQRLGPVRRAVQALGPFQLQSAGPGDAGGDLRRALGRRRQGQVGGGWRISKMSEPNRPKTLRALGVQVKAE
jgi:hypothetical protein